MTRLGVLIVLLCGFLAVTGNPVPHDHTEEEVSEKEPPAPTPEPPPPPPEGGERSYRPRCEVP